MPYRIESNPDGTVKVVNAITGRVYAKRTSKKKAEAQIRIMEASEAFPGFRNRHARRDAR